MPDENGNIKAEHYAQLAKSGIYPPDSELPEFPDLAAHVWKWWSDMSHERPSNGFSVIALTSKFMYDYLSVYGVTPIPIEMELLKAIDRAFIRGHSESSNKG